ncbi:hypothetical protein FP76_gp170 [Bacillus phage Evoli]|uniref:Uncharacterized protein n=1 Tax=Bacillus phage Evoli TaxID=1486658 RepID=A0A024AZX4_9CAUD|nr:hypothetical protein FP76_gp170 [Bacillus phage Evoli]AHZ09924.1 hypothetical protein [Bacillus phage Evoli]
MTKDSTTKRSVSRGHGARGTSGLNNNGADAHANALKKTTGKFRPSFVEMYDNVTEKDIALKETYALDLISKHMNTPREMIQLEGKRNGEVVTLTCLDEVFYVKIGTSVIGKLSIRVQRSYKSRSLLYIFQERVLKDKKKTEHYKKNTTFKQKSKGEIAHDNRKVYRNSK